MESNCFDNTLFFRQIVANILNDARLDVLIEMIWS